MGGGGGGGGGTISAEGGQYLLADYVRGGQFPLAGYVRGDKICGGTESAPTPVKCHWSFVWEWSFLLVARYALLVVFKPTIVDARRSL